jgi:hypothetical protein
MLRYCPFRILKFCEEDVRIFTFSIFIYFPFSDDINWNPIEWDRAAEELTWERVGLIIDYKMKLFTSLLDILF